MSEHKKEIEDDERLTKLFKTLRERDVTNYIDTNYQDTHTDKLLLTANNLDVVCFIDFKSKSNYIVL